MMVLRSVYIDLTAGKQGKSRQSVLMAPLSKSLDQMWQLLQISLLLDVQILSQVKKNNYESTKLGSRKFKKKRFV